MGDWKYYRAIYNAPKANHKSPDFYASASFVGKPNIFQIVDTEQHAARRKLSAAPYSLQSMTRLETLVQAKAKVLVDRLISEAAVSTTNAADAFTLCGLFSFEVVCKAGFNMDFDSNVDGHALSVLRAMDGSAATLIFDGLMPWLRPSGLATKIPGPIGAAFRSREAWVASSRQMVRQYLSQPHSRELDVSLLAPYKDGIDGFLGRKLDQEEFVEEAMGIMFAGSGTTSTTLTYLLYALSLPKNQHVQTRLRQEVMDLDATSDLATLRKAPYLNAVIKETFRLYPTIVSTLPRVLDEPLQVENVQLPPGTVVGMQNYVHHRDPSLFPEPDAFRPERWLQSTADMEAALTPFSVGRRNCIGQNLAWAELYIAVSKVFRHACLSLSDEMKDDDMEMEDRFNIAPKGRKLLLHVASVANSAQ